MNYDKRTGCDIENEIISEGLRKWATIILDEPSPTVEQLKTVLAKAEEK
jgi:hypothetical protein